jgi:hypothetical protein
MYKTTKPQIKDTGGRLKLGIMAAALEAESQPCTPYAQLGFSTSEVTN